MAGRFLAVVLEVLAGLLRQVLAPLSILAVQVVLGLIPVRGAAGVLPQITLVMVLMVALAAALRKVAAAAAV